MLSCVRVDPVQVAGCIPHRSNFDLFNNISGLVFRRRDFDALLNAIRQTRIAQNASLFAICEMRKNPCQLIKINENRAVGFVWLVPLNWGVS